MRIVFMGTPAFAVPTLDALVAAGHRVVAAYCQPPRPGGRRGRALVPSPVQARAEALGIPVRTPASLKGADEQAGFAALGAEIGVVAAYGLILPRAVLDAPAHGCLNVHASLLPRWRGAAPIQRAILAGDAETGVCVMQMEAGLDTGPVRLTGSTPVDGKNAGELTAELAKMGARLVVETLADLDAHPPVAQPDDGVTYAAKIAKSEGRLDFARSAAEVERKVRAMNPPGAWFEGGGERVRVLAAELFTGRGPDSGSALSSFPGEGRGPATERGETGLRPSPEKAGEDGVENCCLVLDDRLTIACASGAIRPTLVQRAGSRPMATEEFLRGFPIAPGTRLG